MRTRLTQTLLLARHCQERVGEESSALYEKETDMKVLPSSMAGAAEMTDGVGIKAWITNSQVVHAVADSPATAPYRFMRKQVVAPVFAHEPTVSRAVSQPAVSMACVHISACCQPDSYHH